MIDFLKRFFGRQNSSETAKERLRLVLMTDHLELAPDMIEAMKRDLVDVISRHVEVDRDKIEVSFERQDRALAMLANIPIISVNRPNGSAHPPEPELPAQPVTPVAKPPVRKRRRRSAKKAPASAPVAGSAPASAGAR